MSLTDEILADVPEPDRPRLAVAANRYTNMVGGRYSDALRDELARYVAVGRDRYLAEEERGRDLVRAMGY